MSAQDGRQMRGFRWNAGGWFGSQIGMTAWILVTAFVLYPVDANVATFVLLFFLFPNVIGTWLWTRRARISPYKAVQSLVVMAGGSSMGVIFVVVDNGHWADVQQYGGSMSARTTNLLILTLVVGLLLLFHYLNRQHAGSDGE